MVDSPDKIQEGIDNNIYKWQDYDVSKQIHYAIRHKLKYVTVKYPICTRLQEELRNKGYKVKKADNWFFGEQTMITW